MTSRLGSLLGLVVLVAGLGLAGAERAAALETGIFGRDLVRPTPGAPVEVPSRPPSVDVSASALGSAFGPEWRPGSGIARASHLPVPDPATPPFSAHGKLLIAIGGFRASCSGTVINTPNESTMVTAAHCVREGYGRRGRWADRIVFIPAYERGRRPYRSFVASHAWVPRGYWRSQNPNFDVAVVRLQPNPLGRVAAVVGGRGWSAGVSRRRRYQVYGYPAGAMRGEIPRGCVTRVIGVRWIARFLPGPVPSKIHCRMASGSSGGGWVYDREYLNSVISHSVPGEPDFIYGPFFGRDFRRLINRYG